MEDRPVDGPQLDPKHEDWDELIPPEGHPDVGKECFRLVEAVIADKENLGKHDDWRRAYELINNKHWKNAGKKIDTVSINLLWTQHNRTVNQLTDNNPIFDVKACGEVAPNVEEGLDRMQKTIDHYWRETEQQDEFESSVRNGEMYGVTNEKSIFNPDLEFGMGDPETIVLDPMHFGLYPVKTRKVQKAQACLHYHPMSVRDVERMYPDAKGKIKSDTELIKELNDGRRESLTNSSNLNTGSINFGGEVKQALGYAGEPGEGKDQETLIVEVWCKDYTEIKNEIEQEDGTLIEESRPKYTGYIRKITTCSAGTVVLDDVDNPSINPELDPELQRLTYLYDKFPFISAQSYKDTTNFWSQGEVEQLKGLNKELDKAITQFNSAKDKSARRTLINPKNSGVDNSQIKNGHTIIRPAMALNHGISWMQPPGIDPEVLKAIDFYKEFFFIVSGSFDVDQAQMMQGGDRLAYKSIAALLERASTMLRGKVRAYSRLIRERGRMAISHMQNWYTEDRYISYDEDGERQTIPVNQMHLLIPARLTVVSGSTLPKSRIQEREEAIRLGELRFIDPEAVLKAMDFDGRKEIIARMKMGPVGEFLQKMSKLLPPQIVQQMAQYAKMDMKDFAKLLQAGKLQPIQMPQQGVDPVKQAAVSLELEEKKMKVTEAKKKVEKTEAERQKILAEIRKILVEAGVAVEGVRFDDVKLWMQNEELKIKRAEAASDVIDRREQNRSRRVDDLTKAGKVITQSAKEKKQGPYAERGLESNNKGD